MHSSLRFLSVCLVLSVSPLASAKGFEFTAPSEKELAKLIGGPDVLDALEKATRVEAVPLREKKLPGGYRKYVESGRRRVLPAEQAASVQALLRDRRTYFTGSNACIFDPGIKFIVHREGAADVEFLLCLHCADVEIQRDEKRLGFVSFVNGYTKAYALAVAIFPNDKGVQKLIAEKAADEERGKKRVIDQARWEAAIPKSLRRFWNDALSSGFPSYDIKPMRPVLARAIPDERTRILILLNWFGSGEGPWTGYPGYETIPEKLLLEYPTENILHAIESTTLTEAQTEGAARFFGAWTFSKERPNDLKKLPVALKKTLLKHTLKSPEKANRDYAKHAFR